MTTPSGFEVLEILALQGKDLPNKDYWKKQDPFLQYEIGSQLKRTRVDKKGGRNPEWNQRTRFDRLRAPISGNMKVKCYDDDLIGKPKFIGECVIDLGEIYSEGDMDSWFTLYDAGEKAGQIYLEMTFYASDGVTRRRKVLDDERRSNRRKTMGSRSGSQDSLASQVDKLELAGPPVNPIKHDPKPEPKVEANAQPTSSKENSIPKPQESTQTAPQTTSSVLSHSQNSSTDAQTKTASPIQIDTKNAATQPPILPSTNPVATSPTSINHPAPTSSTVNATANDTTAAHIPAALDQSKARTETLLQNQPITTAPHTEITANPIANPAISNIKADSLSSISSNPTAATPIQISSSPVVAPVLSSEPVTTSSASSFPVNPTPVTNTSNQAFNQQAHLNSIDSTHSKATQNPDAQPNSMNSSVGSQPSTYADNATSASSYPQISAAKPFTYGNIQPTTGSQSQSVSNAQHVSNAHKPAQPAIVANPVDTQPIQNSQEQTYSNISQPSNQGIATNPVRVSQSKPIEQQTTGINDSNFSSNSMNSQSQVHQDAAQVQPAQNYPVNTNPIQPTNPIQNHQTYETQSPVASQPQNQNIATQSTQVSQQHTINPTVTHSYPPPQPHTVQNTHHVGAQPPGQHTVSQPAQVSQQYPANPVTSQTYPPGQPHVTHGIQSASTQKPCEPEQLDQHTVSQHPQSNPPQPAITTQPQQYHNTHHQSYPPVSAPHHAATTQFTSTQAPCGPQQLDQHIVSQHPESNSSQPAVTAQPQQYPNAQPQTYPPVSASHPIVTTQPHPHQHPGYSHSNSFSSTNSYQPSLPATHQYPSQSYPTPPGVNTYSPPTTHQPYPPAPYPSSQSYPISSYGGYPSTNELHYNPYPQPQETGPRPLFPSVADHVYEQPYQQSHYNPYPVRQDSYPQPPSHISPTGSQYYPPGPPDSYSSQNSISYHRPTSFPAFPSAYSDNGSPPPPLPNKPNIPDTYVMETPPPLPSRPPTMSFPILQTNNTTSPPLPPNHPNNQNNQNQSYGGASGVPYGSQSDPDKKKNKSDLDKLKKMFKQFI